MPSGPTCTNPVIQDSQMSAGTTCINNGVIGPNTCQVGPTVSNQSQLGLIEAHLAPRVPIPVTLDPQMTIGPTDANRDPT